jgi:hypothetical protein
MKGYRGSRGTAPLILNLGMEMDKRGQLHAPAALLQRRTSMSTEQQAGWTPASDWTFRRREIAHIGARTLNRLSQSLVVISNEIRRLSHLLRLGNVFTVITRRIYKLGVIRQRRFFLSC